MSEVIAHRQVALLKVADPRVMDEIRAVLPLDDFVLAWVSPTEAVIDPARIGEIGQRLADRGLTPLMKRVQGSETREVERVQEPTERTRRLR